MAGWMSVRRGTPYGLRDVSAFARGASFGEIIDRGKTTFLSPRHSSAGMMAVRRGPLADCLPEGRCGTRTRMAATSRVLFAGIDVGASATKAALIDASGALAGFAVVPSGVDFAEAGEAAFARALEVAGARASDVLAEVSTGYGRKNVRGSGGTKTEIACHARGAHFHFPAAITVVDIGGQDNKIIKLDAAGNRLDFKMNRKCAAGTGAFLDEIARRLGVGIEEMEGLAQRSTRRVEIGSFCTVFSATEILGLVRRGVEVQDIAKGAFRSVVKRITEMDQLSGRIVATGGVVAHNPTIVALLAEALELEVLTPPHPQLVGALGAALYARDEVATRSA
jgi:(R)-2-hydroxyacyl-CoA dehydratese activating ATPase